MFDAHRDDPEFGYRFLVAEADDAGQPMAERTAWRICADNGWWSVFGKRKRGKNGKPGPPVHDDLVGRDFTAQAPNQLWLADITEHRTAEGKLYLCAIKDVFSNRIVGYSIDSRMKSRLATAALHSAIARRGHRTGGQALAGDVNAMALTHEGAPTHMTVVGHSYGSTTVSDAAAGFGMHADDVVLVGSPGTDMAHSASDFHLNPGGHLYVGDASGDAVGWFGHGTARTPVGGVGLGDDPAMDGYGSVRFKAEVPGMTANPVGDHSHYFDTGSESLFSIGDVVSGHGDALEHDDMTAPHRGEYGLPAFVEPEAVRPGTTGHRHGAPAG